MKKIKIFTLLTASLAATTPITLLAGCSTTKPANDYENLVPSLKNDVVETFKKLAKIPRTTNHLNKIRTALYDWANENNITLYRDSYGNMWFDVEASDQAYANYPKIILQGHMDMVFSYDSTQFTTAPDPLTYIVELDETIDSDGRPIIHSRNYKTSIGADDGIGLAIAMSLALNKKVKHGPLRILITADEESGMRGASNLDPIALDTDYLINIDEEEPDQICKSAMGAAQGIYTYRFASNAEEASEAFEIKIENLAGGHSGTNIGTGTHNAIKIASQILTEINKLGVECRIVNWSTPGITTPTTIANACTITFYPKNDVLTIDKVKEICSAKQKEIAVGVDTNATITASIANMLPGTVSLSAEDTKKLIQLVDAFYYGVYEWQDEAKTIPGTSQNVGPIVLTPTANKKYIDIELKTYSRSNVDEYIDRFVAENKLKAESIISDITYSNPTKYYPWKEIQNNKTLELMTKAYKNFNVEPKVFDSTGGLEPTWFIQKHPTLNPIAIGPRIDNAHKPTETVYIDSLDTTLKALLYAIDNIVDYK